MHARHTDTNRHESIARTDANRARRSRNVARARVVATREISGRIYGCGIARRVFYAARFSSLVAAARDERRTRRVTIQGRHPGGNTPSRRSPVASSGAARVYRRLRRPPRGRTFPERASRTAPTTSETRRELVCTSGVRDDASEARARVDGSGHPSNQWAPIGTPSPSTRARAILGRLSASSPRDGRGVVHAANARHAVDVTSWAASTAAHTTTATAAAAAYTADRSSRRVFLTAVSLGVIRVDHRLETAGDAGGRGSETTRRAGARAVGGRRVGDAQRRYEVHDVPEDVGDDAQAPRRAPVHHRACVEGRETSESVRRGAGGSRAGFLRGRGGCTAPRPGGRTVPDVRHARPRVDPPPARGVECRPPRRASRVFGKSRKGR